MRTNGEKIVYLYVESAKILYNLRYLQLILEWVDLVDYVFPVQSTDVNLINFFININKAVILMESPK
jgi:hypothetical protein